jgi:hypothetical protein
MDLVALLAGLSVYRIHPTVHLPMRRSRLDLGALRPAWKQTHARMQFLEMGLSAFSTQPVVHLFLRGKKL